MYNKLLEKAILPFADVITGRKFHSLLRQQRKIDSFSKDELSDIQLTKLKKLLLYAKENSKYYKDRIHFNSDDIVGTIRSVPILEKNDVRNKLDEILTVRKENLLKVMTSGSSGIQTTVYTSKLEQSYPQAIQTRWWEWAGYSFGDPLLQTGITPQRTAYKKVKDILLRTHYFHAFIHNKKEAEKALLWAQKQKNPVLGGYSSSLYVLASYAQELGIDLKFKTAISWGDKMFDHYRAKIDEVFKVKVYESYGTSEGFMIASQKDLDYLYYMNPHIYLEIVDDNGKEVPDGEIGHVVLTNLNAYSMPLIRYKIGDIAIKLPISEYPDHKLMNYPLLKKVIGRDTDLVKTRSGKILIVHSFTKIFEFIPSVVQFSVIQNDYDGILIKIIPAKDFKDEVYDNIRNSILNNLGEPFKIDFQIVDHIPSTRSGKPQIIVSNIK